MGKIYAHANKMIQVKTFSETNVNSLEQAMNRFFTQLGSYNEQWDPESHYKFNWDLVDIKMTMDGDGFHKLVMVIINANFRLGDIPAINTMLAKLNNERKEEENENDEEV